MEYKISAATACGALHQAKGLPGQDKVRCERRSDVLCGCLADGAGSYPDSGEAAEAVTCAAAEYICAGFEELYSEDDETARRKIVEACKNVPVTPNCTFLFFAAHRDGRFLAGHIGDGMMIWLQDEMPSVFSYPENGEFPNETVFVSDAEAEAHLRLQKGRLDSGGAVLLMSDGTAENLYSAPKGEPTPACVTIARWLREGDEDDISKALEENLQNIFVQRSYDDQSIIVIDFWPSVVKRGFLLPKRRKKA